MRERPILKSCSGEGFREESFVLALSQPYTHTCEFRGLPLMEDGQRGNFL